MLQCHLPEYLSLFVDQDLPFLRADLVAFLAGLNHVIHRLEIAQQNIDVILALQDAINNAQPRPPSPPLITMALSPPRRLSPQRRDNLVRKISDRCLRAGLISAEVSFFLFFFCISGQ